MENPALNAFRFLTERFSGLIPILLLLLLFRLAKSPLATTPEHGRLLRRDRQEIRKHHPRQTGEGEPKQARSGFPGCVCDPGMNRIRVFD
ncbi:hypothetical protein [uncultured Roseobacter sp.]|uniref:hypothetical protein n=1 Tax=uncultured Roseobacter sp. TaxID=114847 RepID=UPI00260AB066|nr:hypothetical protein [uncultured Roseobacter sp.]